MKDIFEKVKEKFLPVLFYKKGQAECPWSILDVIIIAVLLALFIFHDPFRIGVSILKFLRLHFFIFTKEPKLLYYLTIYINTIIFKVLSLILLVIFVKSRKASFRDLFGTFHAPKISWGTWIPLYLIVCVILRFISLANPLIPSIPYDSVFPEARIIGNLVVIISILFVAPFVEEILFRGFLYPALNKYMGIYPSVVLTSALFTLAHYPQIKEDYFFIGAIFVLGLLMTYAKAKTGSTWPAIVMHHLYNLVYVVIGFVNYIIVRY